MEALAAADDARYRHLVLRDRYLSWQAPTEAMRAAGLATLLGVRAD